MLNESKSKLLEFLESELEGNLQVLIDPKQKDSFSRSRINVWKQLVSERIYTHLTGENNES